MPQGREPTSETAGKEFAISVLLSEIHSTSAHVDMTESNADAGDESAPDRFVWLGKSEADRSLLVQKTGELMGAEKIVNDSWKARLSAAGKVLEFWVGDQPAEIIEEQSGTGEANQDDSTRLQRELANTRVLGALQWLRKFNILGV